MQKKKTHTTTTRNTVVTSVRLGVLTQPALAVVRAEWMTMSSYIADLIRRDLEQRRA